MAEEIANVNEKQLFHGTKCEAIETICRNGLDWRMCGENGVAFGQGKQWPCEQNTYDMHVFANTFQDTWMPKCRILLYEKQKTLSSKKEIKFRERNNSKVPKLLFITITPYLKYCFSFSRDLLCQTCKVFRHLLCPIHWSQRQYCSTTRSGENTIRLQLPKSTLHRFFIQSHVWTYSHPSGDRGTSINIKYWTHPGRTTAHVQNSSRFNGLHAHSTDQCSPRNRNTDGIWNSDTGNTIWLTTDDSNFMQQSFQSLQIQCCWNS